MSDARPAKSLKEPSRAKRRIRVGVRYAKEEDLPDLQRIYNEAIINSPATFDLNRQTLGQRRDWYKSHDESHPIMVALVRGRVVGYASLSKFREKPAYSRTAESSVYVDREFRGSGVGTALMGRLVTRAKKLRYHAIVAAVVPPNEPSVRLHEGLGYVHVGTLRQVGFKFGKWQDVRWYQLVL